MIVLKLGYVIDWRIYLQLTRQHGRFDLHGCHYFHETTQCDQMIHFGLKYPDVRSLDDRENSRTIVFLDNVMASK